MGTRRTRRYKMRRPLFAFGQLMLPLVGLVALGLLMVGVKLFFLPGESKDSLQDVPETSPRMVGNESPGGAIVVPTPGEPSSGQPFQIAVPANNNLHNSPAPPSQIAVPVGAEQPGIAVPVKKEMPKTPSPYTSKPANGTLNKPLSKGSWGVQIGAFTRKDQAQTLMAKLQKTGARVVITTGNVNGKTYYRVRVIAGKTRGDAEKLERSLRSKGYPTLIVKVL